MTPEEPAWTRKEVNTRAFKAGIVYLRRELGQAALETFCADTGLPYEYLVNENNWVSVAWLNRFYQRMVDVTGRPDAPYESGLVAVEPEVWGSIYFLFRAVGSPGFLYRQLCDLTPDFNKTSRFELVHLGRNHAELRYYCTQEHYYVCDNRRGQLAAVPMVWGLPRADVVEEQCCTRGAPFCHYRISWINRSRALLPLMVAAPVGVAAWFAAQGTHARPAWMIAGLTALSAFLAVRAWGLLRTEHDNTRFNQLQNDKLKASMKDLETKYDEVRKASQVIEDLNINLERKVEDRTAELRHAQAELEASFRKLQDLDRLKSQFFSNITHEFRTPLTMILAPLDSLLNGEIGNLGPQEKDYLRPIQRNALKLLRLINDLLDLAKMDEDYLRLRPETTDLVGLVTEIAEQSRPLAARKDIDLELDIRGTAADLEVDVEKMERAIVNLVANALKFTSPGGRVRIWMNATGDTVMIGVLDSGVGIAETDIGHVFERFRQADGSATRRYGGTGIGLALAREIVELHGGHISVESRESEGSEFVIHLKRGSAHLQPELLDRRQSTDPGPAAGRRGEDRGPREWTQLLLGSRSYRFLQIDEATDRRVAARSVTGPKAAKVLVVEDNSDVLQFISLQLSDEYEVYLAQDGLQGLGLATRELPDVIVADYMMPEMDGVALVRALRAHPQTQQIPIVMLTAKVRIEHRIEAREAGADVYLSKPFSPRELRSAIAHLLERRGRQLSMAVHEQVKSLELISAGLAHEIHNPLNYIRTALFVIQESTDKIRELARVPNSAGELAGLIATSQERIDRMYDVALKGIARISRIVGLVREYAHDGYSQERVPICVDAVVRDMAPLFSPMSEHDVTVNLDLQAGDVQVSCVPEEIHRAIGSLWQNALDAVGPSGQVMIRTRVQARDFVLEVIDDGPGIPRDQLSRVFVPFYTTKPPGKGLGLGLAIAHQVVSQAGGSLTVDTVVGHGSTFRIRLPVLVEGALPEPAPGGAPPDDHVAVPQ